MGSAATSLTRGKGWHLLRGTGFWLALIGFLVVVLLPIYYIFLAAFAPGTQLFTQPLSYLPQSYNLERYREIFDALPIGRYVVNTVFLATATAIISLVVSLMAAYAIARLQFPGANLVLIGLLLSSMLPYVSTIIPLFKLYQRVHLMDTMQGLLILYVSAVLPLTTWILVSFIKQLPQEVEEAARVDGAGFFAMMRQIIFPMLAPSLATLFLINFIVSWNEFFTPLIFARGDNSKVIMTALSEAGSIGSGNAYYTNWGNISAVAILATVPVFILTLVFQRRITEGITSGAIK